MIAKNSCREFKVQLLICSMRLPTSVTPSGMFVSRVSIVPAQCQHSACIVSASCQNRAGIVSLYNQRPINSSLVIKLKRMYDKLCRKSLTFLVHRFCTFPVQERTSAGYASECFISILDIAPTYGILNFIYFSSYFITCVRDRNFPRSLQCAGAKALICAR